MPQAYIGTSGFMYPHWRGNFYPQDLPQRKWFEYYCQHFNSVELNVSFYRLPKKEVFENWRRRAGPKFVFSVKGSRFITHIKRLKDCEVPLKIFFDSLGGLTSREVRPHQEKHVILWQLPPSLRQDLSRLEEFLKAISLLRGVRHAFEFRHETWLGESTWVILKKYQAAAVFQDWPDWPVTCEVTAGFVYLRFHGNRQLYSSEYTEEELVAWARKIKNWLKKGKDIYAYFNNDSLGYAVPNARRLKELLQK